MTYYVNIVIRTEAKDITEAVDKANAVINYSQIDSPVNDRETKIVQFSVQPEQKEGKK